MNSRVFGLASHAGRSSDRQCLVIAEPLGEQLHPLLATIPSPFSVLLGICLVGIL